ncbi:MAG: hypothetical protein ACE5FA_05225, partial [Dehalococcoidia bacterium]
FLNLSVLLGSNSMNTDGVRRSLLNLVVYLVVAAVVVAAVVVGTPVYASANAGNGTGCSEVNNALITAGVLSLGDAAGFPATLGLAAPAQGQGTGTCYRLTEDLDLSGAVATQQLNAIEIVEDNVTLYLNGHVIRNVGLNNGFSTGILIRNNSRNIRIVGPGTIEWFRRGIHSEFTSVTSRSGDHHSINDVSVLDSDLSAISLGDRANVSYCVVSHVHHRDGTPLIDVGDFSTVRGNHVVDLPHLTGDAAGIRVGDSSLVEHNVIGPVTGLGIDCGPGATSRAIGNVLDGINLAEIEATDCVVLAGDNTCEGGTSVADCTTP